MATYAVTTQPPVVCERAESSRKGAGATTHANKGMRRVSKQPWPSDNTSVRPRMSCPRGVCVLYLCCMIIMQVVKDGAVRQQQGQEVHVRLKHRCDRSIRQESS